MSEEKIVSYKGMDKDMKCRGMQYEVGKTYETKTAKVCECGFHACKMPLEVFNYYPPSDRNRYFKTEQSGEIDQSSDDSKAASTKLTVVAEIGIPGLVKAHIEWVKEHIDGGKLQTDTGARSAATNTGYRSVATNTGARSAATNTGDYSVATNTGDYSVAEVSGKGNVAVSTGRKSKARGNIGCAIVLVERGGWDGEIYPIKDIKAVMIDGETYKPNVWYKLEYGKIVEVSEDA